MNKSIAEREVVDAELVTQPQLPSPVFDISRVAQVLAGHLGEVLQASPDQWGAVDHIKVAVEPVITYRVEMTVFPRR